MSLYVLYSIDDLRWVRLTVLVELIQGQFRRSCIPLDAGPMNTDYMNQHGRRNPLPTNSEVIDTFSRSHVMVQQEQSQPETRPTFLGHLVIRARAIYCELTLIEVQRTQVDEAQSKTSQDFDATQWQIGVALLHNPLLQEHHNLFLASESPCRIISSKHSVPNPIGPFGMNPFLGIHWQGGPPHRDHLGVFICLAQISAQLSRLWSLIIVDSNTDNLKGGESAHNGYSRLRFGTLFLALLLLHVQPVSANETRGEMNTARGEAELPVWSFPCAFTLMIVYVELAGRYYGERRRWYMIAVALSNLLFPWIAENDRLSPALTMR